MFKKINLTLFVFIAIISIFVSPEAFSMKAKVAVVESKAVENKTAQDYASDVWTLEGSVQRVLSVSPYIQMANADKKAWQGALSQAGAWPNPDFGVSISNKIGKDDNAGGIDLTQLAVSQQIPIGRLSRQRQQAKAYFEASDQNLFFQRLIQETTTAHHFHLLQLMIAKLSIANEQLNFADQYQKNNDNDDRLKDKNSLVRYLNPLEQKRLDIMRATASQEVANIEGKYSEAVSGFNTLLRLKHDEAPVTTELKPIDNVEILDILLSLQESKHPAILAGQYQEDAANTGVSLARLERLEDPTITALAEQDFLDDKRQNFFGFSINLKLPFWDRKQGTIHKAKAEAEKVKYHQMALRQELESKLREVHLHLGHLMKQTDHYYTELLLPAQEVFELTQKSFNVGEVNVLSLVDANNTYFDARRRYLELLYETQIELAELRLSAGISLIDQMKSSDEKKAEVSS